VLLAIVVGATGVLETFYYVPTPESAALSVQTITYLVPFGGLIRNLHYWSAQLLLLVMLVHLARVVLTGAYAPPRRFNHWLGLVLLSLAVLLDFTGYVLRWDKGIQWAIVVGTNLLTSIPILGGTAHVVVTGAASLGDPASVLLRLYAWHIFGLGLLFITVAGWHLFRLRRDGGIAVPPPSLRENHDRISRHDLVRREFLATMLAGAALLILAVAAPAPIAAPITSLAAVDNAAKAPWFFLWVQQLLRWGDPFLLGVVVPLAVLGFLAIMPIVLPVPAPGELGRWFPRSGRTAQAAFVVLLLSLAILTALAWLTEA
jgi:quinol-cytochrome oxidoreductase complex cytochrome b subunit